MPITPQRITQAALTRTAETTLTYGGEVCHLTYYVGRVTATSRTDVEAWQAEVAGCADEQQARLKFAEKACGWLASWDVLASDEEGAAMYPLEPEAVAKLDIDFLTEALVAVFQDNYQQRGAASASSAPNLRIVSPSSQPSQQQEAPEPVSRASGARARGAEGR